MWLLLMLVPTAVFSASVDLCEPARKEGVNMTSFFVDVAHGMHSITVEDIQYFFDEKFPIENSLPTANLDLTGPKVLMFVPSRPSSFKFPGGAAVDFILSNNDDPLKFGSAGQTSLEEIVHQMHMLEMWNKASKMYKTIKTKRLDTQQICPCLVSHEQKEKIIDRLALLSTVLQARIPEPIVDGERRLPIRQGRSMRWNAWYKVSIDNLDKVDGTSSTRQARKIEGEIYRTIDGEEYQIVPELKDSKTWNSYWKSKFIQPDSKEAHKQRMFDFAMYMYCKINLKN